MWREGRGYLAPDSRGEFAAAAVGRYADLEGAVGMCAEETECAEGGGVGHVNRDAVSAAELGDV